MPDRRRISLELKNRVLVLQAEPGIALGRGVSIALGRGVSIELGNQFPSSQTGWGCAADLDFLVFGKTTIGFRGMHGNGQEQRRHQKSNYRQHFLSPTKMSNE